jgi:transposase
MSTKAPNLRQFQARFPTEESCLDHLMRTRYGARHDCGGCGREASFYRVKARRSYACEHCGFQVYPTAGTPFERTRTPLRDWFFVMFQFCASCNGVAAKAVERQLGVTYKTAWRMCHAIREYMGAVDGNGPVGGFTKQVEIDETFIGGCEAGATGGQGKALVFGIMERGGNISTQVVPNRSRATLLPIVSKTVKRHSTIHTDEHSAYQTLAAHGFYHRTSNHNRGEYVSPSGSTVNGIEGYWMHRKRGINGTHIHVSPRHLPKYLAEFEYRWNMRSAPSAMLDRLMVSFAR